MFANTQMAGLDTAFPDVCLTPTPAGVPAPVPYPNSATAQMGVPPVVNVLFMAAPVHNLGTVIPMTNGDNAGVSMGAASGTVMGPSRHLTGSNTTLVGGMPVTRLSSMSMQNSTKAVGARIVPSQTKVLVLAP
ncbi:MAG: DUF4150 domain-containing protein [Myxococcota bacterium]